MKTSDKFLNELSQIVRYWVNIANVPSDLKENETKKEYRLLIYTLKIYYYTLSFI